MVTKSLPSTVSQTKWFTLDHQTEHVGFKEVDKTQTAVVYVQLISERSMKRKHNAILRHASHCFSYCAFVPLSLIIWKIKTNIKTFKYKNALGFSPTTYIGQFGVGHNIGHVFMGFCWIQGQIKMVNQRCWMELMQANHLLQVLWGVCELDMEGYHSARLQSIRKNRLTFLASNSWQGTLFSF